ncbi:MAG: HAD-IIB family hydrolase [Acidimicrobiia bacterium]|nr:HAD-IIB family hydrolase [Acidimicrobiia bacterium]
MPHVSVVFTDLDGTLLDHETYQPGPALPALRELLAEGVAVYFCSAKTWTEQTVIAAELDVAVGFIVENGAAVYEPDGSATVFGTPYRLVRRKLAEAAATVGARVRGYGDMPVSEVMRHTGLDADRAEYARKREYTESFIIESGDSYELGQAMAIRGLRLQRGSRFWTAQGEHDKGQAVGHVIARFGDSVESYGLGDYDNDIGMLNAVDTPMLVQLPDGSWRDLPVEDMIRLDGVGPAGWRSGADLVLRRHSR